MKNNEKILFGVAGFLIAPIKKGMYFGNNYHGVGSKEELQGIIVENDMDLEKNSEIKVE